MDCHKTCYKNLEKKCEGIKSKIGEDHAKAREVGKLGVNMKIYCSCSADSRNTSPYQR